MRYAEPHSPGVVANSFKVMQWAFVAHPPGQAAPRRSAVVRTPFRGSVQRWLLHHRSKPGAPDLRRSDRTDRKRLSSNDPKVQRAQRVLAAPADKVYDGAP